MKEELPFSNMKQLVNFVMEECADVDVGLGYSVDPITKLRSVKLIFNDYGSYVNCEYLNMLEQLMRQYYNKSIVGILFYGVTIENLDLTKLRLQSLEIDECKIDRIDIIPKELKSFICFDTNVVLPSIPLTLDIFHSDDGYGKLEDDWNRRKKSSEMSKFKTLMRKSNGL